MTVKGSIKEAAHNAKANVKEAAGFIQEETGEKLKDREMMNKGRDLRDEGRLEQGKNPKPFPPGTERHLQEEDDE